MAVKEPKKKKEDYERRRPSKAIYSVNSTRWPAKMMWLAEHLYDFPLAADADAAVDASTSPPTPFPFPLPLPPVAAVVATLFFVNVGLRLPLEPELRPLLKLPLRLRWPGLLAWKTGALCTRVGSWVEEACLDF